MNWKDFANKQPSEKKDYLVAAEGMMYVARWNGKKFVPQANDVEITHWVELPLHPHDSIHERRKVWLLDLYNNFKDQYPVEMLRNFGRYWSELFVKGRMKGKMRWEEQKTWEIDLRLKTWARNNKIDGSESDRKPKRITIS